MVEPHAERSHASWSASATARRVHCKGSLVMEAQSSFDKESPDAARGTAGHEIAERALRNDTDTSAYLDDVIKTKSHDIEIDEEIANSAQIYVDYVRERLAKYRAETGKDAVLQIEQRFDLSPLGTPFDAGGTGDAVIYFPRWKELEIVDFKNGRGGVSEKKNPQLRTYGTGALLANDGLDIEWVRSTIVQPRLLGSRPVRDERIHVSELIEWTAELLADMNRAKMAEEAYYASKDNSVLFDEWVDRWLTPGKCTFCRREGDCPKLRKVRLEQASVFFEPDTGKAEIRNQPGDMSPELIASTLDVLPDIEAWIKAVRAHAHNVAESGTEVPGYQLSEKIGNRKWRENDDLISAKLVAETGLAPAQLQVAPKLKSPAQMEKLLGAKRKALIEPFVIREVTGVNLVATEKTTRPPVKSKAEQFIETE
jgi:hypothetical protein